ncbi:putative fungal specific transcription factor domain-containing protein [Rosellinia necatrix]|uniref:Putative fungal specific transcription factor domain-containing protein n=1 Tax=Rosellinia necatrix TaxID=77044 RepID=A0A1W2TII7_ROSNE|nr:putative fungal specific transcription factor domain-containing protein [Rosellinia necatrix]
MEAEMAEGRDGSPPALSRRACDQCRLRKIRCDKETPCSNCRSARRPCSSTGAGQRPKEPRQRVLISSQYERKIDQIEDRLTGIENLLRQLVSARSTPGVETLTPPSSTSQFGQTLGSRSVGASASSVDGTPSGPPNRRNRGVSASEKGGDGENSSTLFDPEDAETFEGNSSLAAHTAFASEFLADAVRKTTLGDGRNINPKFETALNSLRQIINMQNRSRQRSAGKVWSPAPGFTNPVPEDDFDDPYTRTRKQFPRTNLRDLPLPPMALVREQLSQMSHGPVPVMLAILYTFIDYEHFADRCRQLYFVTDTLSEASFIIVNAGLTYIFFEASLTASDPIKKARYDECRATSQNNLEIAIAQLNMMMPATAENIEALLMGASFCIDESRASLAWILVSRAAHMCRTLGYHQIHTMKDDMPQTKADKSLLFWCTYMLDKALSLRLGRASVLQDYDISLPHVTPDAKAAYPGKEVMTLWIQHARVLGRIYERLYSPGALRQPEAMRTEQVGVLAAEQRQLMAETVALLREFEGAPAGEERMFALTLKSDEVSYLASLALTYRALPPDGPRSRTFAGACVDAARASIACHLEATALMGDERSLKIVYIHWTILYAPFIPFIVIFCLVIETSDTTDLARLAAFVRSLETACDVSPSVRKLHQLCHVLYSVAELYVEAKAAAASAADDDDLDGHAAAGSEFDAYLSQLGFMPVVDEGAMMGVHMDGSSGGGVGGVGGGAGAGDVDGLQMRAAAQANQLEDWFSGKNYMMGLLEEDLSGINPMAWHS